MIDKVVSFHLFVGLRETQNEPDHGCPRFEVESSIGLGVELVHVHHIMPCESELEMHIKSIDAT